MWSMEIQTRRGSGTDNSDQSSKGKHCQRWLSLRRWRRAPWSGQTRLISTPIAKPPSKQIPEVHRGPTASLIQKLPPHKSWHEEIIKEPCIPTNGSPAYKKFQP